MVMVMTTSNTMLHNFALATLFTFTVVASQGQGFIMALLVMSLNCTDRNSVDQTKVFHVSYADVAIIWRGD